MKQEALRQAGRNFSSDRANSKVGWGIQVSIGGARGILLTVLTPTSTTVQAKRDGPHFSIMTLLPRDPIEQFDYSKSIESKKGM